MTGQPKMPSLEELIDSAQRRRQGGTRCWAEDLTPEASEYLEALQRAEAARPMTVNRSQVRRDLSEYFGFDINISTVKRHFSRECRCVWPT